jgi:1-deoxy-D-xylulose-5-phosphate synthase
MGSAVMEWMSDHNYYPHVKRLGLPDHFVEHGAINELKAISGIDHNSIKQAFEAWIK